MRILLIFCLACVATAADTPRLEWDPIPTNTYFQIVLETDTTNYFQATNYTVYIGSESRAYTNSVQTGTNAFWVLPKMAPGKTNFFAVTATYDIGQESEYSEEVWYVPNWLTTPYILLSGNTASWATVTKATNYVFGVYSLTYGTNTYRNLGTNNSSTVPEMTNGVWRIQVKAENHHTESRWGLKQVINVPLNVPDGKFYVEKGNTLTNWFTVGTFTGPTTIWFPANQPMGFFRYRSYFVSAASPKGGATKLMAAKQPMIKSAPKKTIVETNTPSILGPINLMPPRR